MAAASIKSSPLLVAIYKDAVATLRRRKRQHTAFRPDHLLEFHKRWLAIPAEERLYHEAERTKKSLVISEVRISSLVMTNAAWGDGQKELDLVIAVLRLTLGAREAKAETYPLAVVSLHAASRRYRRGFFKRACRHYGRPRGPGAGETARCTNAKPHRHSPERRRVARIL